MSAILYGLDIGIQVAFIRSDGGRERNRNLPDSPTFRRGLEAAPKGDVRDATENHGRAEYVEQDPTVAPDSDGAMRGDLRMPGV
jgi:hypothetical protein